MALKLFCDRCGNEIKPGDRLGKCNLRTCESVTPLVDRPTDEDTRIILLCNKCTSEIEVLLFSRKEEEVSG